MTRKKSTKSALLSSVVSLILCFAMLLSTTFAWFTDSVKSENNIIKSGNLDIELEYWDGDSWEDVENATVLTNELWEPGVTEVAYLRVANAGSLALKYQLGINIVSETVGKNAAGGDLRLSDYIQFGVVELDAFTTYASREAAVDAVENIGPGELGAVNKISAGYTKAESMASGDETYLALVVWMPTTVGNEANHNGTDVPEINLGINVFATQMAAEEDSFGSDYDQAAPIVSAPVVRPESAVTLKGAEDVMITLSDDLLDNLPAEITEISMSVSEPVVDASANTITFATIELIDQNGAEIDLSALNTTITVTLPAQDVFAPGETVVLYHDGEYVATAVVNADKTISYEVEHLCEVTVKAVELPAVNEETNVVEISTAAQLFGFAQSVNAGTYYEGKTVVLTKDIDLKNAAWTPIGSATAEHGFMGNFDGNGKTISNLNIKVTPDADGYAYAGFFGITEGVDKDNQNFIKNLKIENVTVNTEGAIVAAAIAYPYYTALENITVCGDIAIKGGDYTAGALAYTRRCVDATNITVAGNAGSYITGRNTVGGVISDIQMNGGLKANYSNFKVSNVTITGNTCVGGISGIIGGQTLNGATVTNVKLVSSDAHVGVVSGAIDAKPVINDATYSNVTGTAAIVGAPYGSGSNKSVVIDGVEYFAVSTGDELKAALAENKNVIFVADITMAATNGGYKKAGIIVNKGQIVNGNGHTLTVTSAGGTWDCAIYLTNGTIKNITVAGAMRGVFTAGQSADLYLDNVTFKNVIYTFNSDDGNKNYTIYISNSNMNGWTSHSDVHKAVVYTNCTFGEGSGYAFCRPYGPTEFVNCTFSAGYTVDETKTTSITYTDCTFMAATSEQLQTLVSNGKTNIYLADGEYNVANCGKKTLTISGSKKAIIKIMNEGENGADYGFDGSTVTFNGVTVDTTANTGSYKGFARMKATFNDCAFVGGGFTTFSSTSFNNCTFDLAGYIWTWGATEVNFTECEFIGDSRTILAHGSANTVITIKNCEFAATSKGHTGSGDWTAAVEIDPVGTNTYTINFVGENTINDNYSGWTRVKDGSTGHTVSGLN